MSRKFGLSAIVLWTVVTAGVALGQPASGRYRVRLNLPPGDDVDAVVRQMVATYRGRLEPYAEEGFVGFVLETSEASIRLLEKDWRVAAVEELPSRSAESGEALAEVQAERPVTVRTDASTVWSRGPYAYDGAGNIKSIGNGTVGSETFVYDAFGRLTYGTAGPGHWTEHEYDAFGNMKTMTVDGTTSGIRTYGVDRATNRISVAGTAPNGSYISGSYDYAGNMTSTNAGETFTWDGLGMMTGSTIGGEQKFYVYTPNDERIAAIRVVGGVRGVTDWTLRDGGAAVIRRYSESANRAWSWTEDYIHQGGRMLAAEVSSSEQRRHFFLDHLGTPRYVTDGGGAELAKYEYYPFGEEASSIGSGAAAERRRFTGHERDLPAVQGSLELDYMHARYYAGAWGRFLSVDPGKDWDLRYPQSWNMYAYVRNNPMNRTDPTGRCGESADFVGPRMPCAARGAQGALVHAGATTVNDAAVRQQYVSTVSRLSPTDSAARTQAKITARAQTSTTGQAIAESMRPIAGEAARAGGTASKTNVAVNEGMAVAGRVGRVALVAGATVSVVRIATAEEGQTARVATQEGGAWAGALAFGAAGAKGGAVIGSFFGPGPGTAIGGIVGGIGGGIVGGILGEKAGDNIYNAAVDEDP